jgi:hypothetical protein
MTDRALLFLASLAAMIGGLAAAIWLIATGQIGTFDGNFLLLCSLIFVLAFGLYLRFLLKTAIATPPPKAEKAAAPVPTAETKPAPTPESVGKT